MFNASNNNIGDNIIINTNQKQKKSIYYLLNYSLVNITRDQFSYTSIMNNVKLTAESNYNLFKI